MVAMAALVFLSKTFDEGNAGHWCSRPWKAKADIRAIADAVTSYAIRNQERCPDTLERLIVPDEDGSTLLDCDEPPVDPWGRPYGYEPAAPGTGVFRVFSLGADGLPGGEGEDQDIDNLLIKEGKI